MKAYTELFDDCMPELPGCEPAFVLHHIKRACNDFYERSLYARETLAPVAVTLGVATYAVAATRPLDFSVGKILSVIYDDGNQPKKIEPRTENQLDIEMPGWRTTQSRVQFYTQPDIAHLTLVYAPDVSASPGLTVRIAKLPKYDGGGIDDDVFDKFAESIAAGVKARLMRMLGKPWANPQLAAVYKQDFDLEVAAASAIAARSWGAGPLRTRTHG